MVYHFYDEEKRDPTDQKYERHLSDVHFEFSDCIFIYIFHIIYIRTDID